MIFLLRFTLRGILSLLRTCVTSNSNNNSYEVCPQGRQFP